jgi:hypothetical protein
MTIPFLILGGLIAIVLPTTTFWGAFYAGLTMPVTLTAAAKRVRPSDPDTAPRLPAT